MIPAISTVLSVRRATDPVVLLLAAPCRKLLWSIDTAVYRNTRFALRAAYFGVRGWLLPAGAVTGEVTASLRRHHSDGRIAVSLSGSYSGGSDL